MKIEELKAKIAAAKVEVRGLVATDVKAAETKMVEVRGLEKQLALLIELGKEEEREMKKQKEENKTDEKVSEMRSLVKQVMGKETTVEERAAITSVENAAVIPKEFVNKLIEIQKGFGSLKGLCDIIPVTKNEGTIPVIDLDQNELLDVLEGDDIVDGTLVTTDVAFKCVKVGLIQTLTSELIDDAEVEIESLVNKNFANIATAKENAKILTVIKDNAAVITGALSYKDVQKEIDASLPSVKAGLVTITNVSGYCLLKAQEDSNKRNLDLITLVNGVEYFYNKPLVTVEDTMLPATDTKTVFYVANVNEAVKYCDRKAVTVARSTEAGFKDDTIKLRILERFIPIKGSVRSLKKIEF